MGDDQIFEGYIIALALFFAAFSYFYLKRVRTKKIQKIAKQLGFEFKRKSNLRNDQQACNMVGLMGLFMNIYNSVSGNRGSVDIHYFEIVKDAGEGNAYQSTLMLKGPDLNLPPFQMLPTYLSITSKREVEMKTFPEFAKKYYFEGLESSV